MDDGEHSPSRDHENVWFDIEKSQERYEALLNSYQNIINDKDAHIKTLEDEIEQCRRDRLDLEDEQFNNIREKDKEIAEAERKINESKMKANNANTENKVVLDSLNRRVDNLEYQNNNLTNERRNLSKQLQDANDTIT